jgi:hypothetical protein
MKTYSLIGIHFYEASNPPHEKTYKNLNPPEFWMDFGESVRSIYSFDEHMIEHPEISNLTTSQYSTVNGSPYLYPTAAGLPYIT